MNNIFQENKKSFFLLLGLLFLLLIVAYFFFYQPKSQELKKKEGQVEILENDNQVLQIKISNVENDSGSEVGIEDYLLENKLPLKPEIEDLILTLQEIESISDSRFDNISFSYGDTAPQREDEIETDVEMENNTQAEADNETNIQEGTVEEETSLENVISFEEIPANLQVITVSFTVTSPGYDNFQQFLKLVENQERMMTITNMDFQQPAELELLESDTETITTNVNITTFYFEG